MFFLTLPWRPSVLAVVVAAVLAGCGMAGSDLPSLPPPPITPYRLGAGDRIRIIVYGDKELSDSFAIADDGSVSLPLAGSVQASGRSTADIATGIAAALESRGMMRDPSVAVEVETYRPIFILGEVTKPGQYPYEPGMTAIAAVSIAGGYTYRAIESYVGILRKEGTTSVTGRTLPQDKVAPGDVITVYDRRF
jgi:polysaccharide export outer membrane protein